MVRQFPAKSATSCRRLAFPGTRGKFRRPPPFHEINSAVTPTIRTRCSTLRRFALAAALLGSLHAARGSVTTGGNFTTGTPTPTLGLTAPITFTITGSFQALVFDEGVTSDGSTTGASGSPAGQTLSYQINGGGALTLVVINLVDNFNSAAGALTPNDGYLLFTSQIAVTTGQPVTFLPGALTFASGGAVFNQPPAVFNSNVLLATNGGVALANPVSAGTVPEPSAWACVAVGAGLLSFATLRRAKARA